MPAPFTPPQLAEEMRRIVRQYDTCCRTHAEIHALAEDLMMRQLKSLGYGEAVAVLKQKNME